MIELSEFLERTWAPRTRRKISAIVGATEETVISLLQHWELHVKRRVDELSEADRALLARIQRDGGKSRGENLRRELLLEGKTDPTEQLLRLVDIGILLMIPSSGEIDFDVDEVMRSETALQRDLLLPELPSLTIDGMRTLQTVADVHDILSSTTRTLEFNLLFLSANLLLAPLKLNKSGAPNRRNLVKLGSGLVLPGTRQELGESFDMQLPEHIDYLNFVLAMCLELGLIHMNESVVADVSKIRHFFKQPERARDRVLVDAFRRLKIWSEVDSVQLESVDDDEHLSLTRQTGSPFAGLRAFVLSILRRAPPVEWTLKKDLANLCHEIDDDFLEGTLTPLNLTPTVFLDAMLCRGLFWLGMLEVAKSNNEDTVRATERGKSMLQMDVEEAVSSSAMKLIVQPNLEVTVFIDEIDLHTMATLQIIGTRETLADRVAVFRLAGDSVQRGYTMGLSASEVEELLKSKTPVPLPESVVFQLHDWERLHRRVTLHLGGFLVRHPDPDTLDMSVGQIRHDDKADVVRLGPSTAYLSALSANSLRRLKEDGAVVLNYTDALPPSLTFSGPMTVVVKLSESDVFTMFELRKVAEPKTSEVAGEFAFELIPEKLLERWETASRALDFLDRHTKGGIPAIQRVLLQHALVGPSKARMLEDVTVLKVEDDEIAGALMEMSDFRRLIEERLGTAAFLVPVQHIGAVEELLSSLGIFKVED